MRSYAADAIAELDTLFRATEPSPAEVEWCVAVYRPKTASRLIAPANPGSCGYGWGSGCRYPAASDDGKASLG